MWSDMKFFQMWYTRLNKSKKDKVKKLVKDGRFEFANAGWTMHDETLPNYEDILNNYQLGH